MITSFGLEAPQGSGYFDGSKKENIRNRRGWLGYAH